MVETLFESLAFLITPEQDGSFRLRNKSESFTPKAHTKRIESLQPKQLNLTSTVTGLLDNN